MLMDGEITEPRTSPPKRAGDYTLGRTLMFLIDFLDEQEHIASRLFINGAASDPDVALAIPQALLDQHRVDAAILCVPGWDKVAAYPESLLDRLRPDRVVLSHYDDFFAPYVSGQDPNHGMRFVPFADYDGFVEKLTTVNRHRPKPVAVIEPKTGETICLTC
jgi:catechol 2,3-dioxygenase-like lactoylglutathione lyase family enzyme